MSCVTLAFVRWGDALHVMGSPDGSAAHLRPIGVFTPDWPEVDVACATVETLVRHAADSGEFALAAVDELRRAASWLFDELFPDAARRWLRHGTGTLTLSLDPALLHIPWELAHTSTDFLCLRWAVGRVAQHDLDPALHRPLDPSAPRSVLIIADPDDRLAEAYNEGIALRDQLGERDAVSVTLRAADVEAAQVRRRAREVDILHFAGHIDSDGWRMSESRFDRSDLDRMTGGASMPALVFANGCGATAPEDWDRAMLRAWLASGVRHYLGPLYDVPDRLGRAFAVAFYDALLGGATVGEAVRSARALVADTVGEGTIPWGAYVLYGDPNATYAPARRSPRPPPIPRHRRPTRLAPGTPRPEIVRRADAIEPRRAPSSSIDWHQLLFPALVLFVVALAIGLSVLVSGAWAPFDDPTILGVE